MQLQVKVELTGEITHLGANKHQTRYCLTYLEVWKDKKKVCLIFCRSKDIMKRKYYVFSDYKERNKVYLADLGCKLNQDKYG